MEHIVYKQSSDCARYSKIYKSQRTQLQGNNQCQGFLAGCEAYELHWTCSKVSHHLTVQTQLDYPVIELPRQHNITVYQMVITTFKKECLKSLAQQVLPPPLD